MIVFGVSAAVSLVAFCAALRFYRLVAVSG
jgi:hypothetical protein